MADPLQPQVPVPLTRVIHQRQRLSLGFKARHHLPRVHAQLDDLECDAAAHWFFLLAIIRVISNPRINVLHEKAKLAGEKARPHRVGSGVLPIDLPKQPRARVSPVAFGRRLRDAQRVRRLCDRHSDEIPEFNQFRLARVVRGEVVERLVHGELFIFVTAGRGELHRGVIKVDPLQTTPVTDCFLASSVVDNDAAHGLGRDSKEMGASLPLPALLTCKLEPRFMHQGGGLEGLSGSFAGKPGGSETAKFVVDQREKSLGGLGLT